MASNGFDSYSPVALYCLLPSTKTAVWPILAVYSGWVNSACGVGYFCLSKMVGLITIPDAKDVLAGVKSLTILNRELSKYLISLMKSYTS